MPIKIEFLKAALQIAAGQIGLQSLLLIRNVLLARMLPPEQFGVALTFVTILAALDAISELGIELFLVRSDELDNRELQNTLQGMLIARGLFSSALLFILAAPIAQMFNSINAIWAYQALSIIPFIRGFMHLDLRRFERALLFWPGIATNFFSVAAGTGLSVTLAYLTADFSALLYGSIAQVGILVIGSHLLADRSYRFALNRQYMRKLGAFGLPLILNGIVIFLATQGDRVLVGSLLGVRELANYGVMTILTGGATLLIARVIGTLFLPTLTKSNMSDVTFARRYEICGAITAVAAMTMLITFSLLGAPIAQLLYGPNYSFSPVLFTALAAAAGFKTLRILHQNAFLALGITSSALFANVLAAIGVLAAILPLHANSRLDIMIVCMIIGEATALAFSIGSVWRVKRIWHSSGRVIAVIYGLLALTFLLSYEVNLVPTSPIALIAVTIVLLLVMAVVVLKISKESAQALQEVLNRTGVVPTSKKP